jgi:hypothetical protein
MLLDQRIKIEHDTYFFVICNRGLLLLHLVTVRLLRMWLDCHQRDFERDGFAGLPQFLI